MFSADGRHFALSRIRTSLPVVECYATADWFANPQAALAPRWASANIGRLPTLNAEGRRLAFFHAPTTPGASYALVVVETAGNAIVWSKQVYQTPLARPSLSADGRSVAWTSPSSPSRAVNQVWRADVDAGTIMLVSVAPDGITEGNGNSKFASLSADGRYVAFASLADNLVADDTNGAMDVFLRDLQTGRTLLVSRTPSGAPGGGWSLRPFFSARAAASSS